MKLSELIAAYGDDKVRFQNLDQCATALNMEKKGTKITFVTEQQLNLKGTEQLGLVVWLDRKAVAEITAAAKDRGEFDNRAAKALAEQIVADHNRRAAPSAGLREALIELVETLEYEGHGDFAGDRSTCSICQEVKKARAALTLSKEGGQ